VIIEEAIGESGPAIVLSFVLAGVRRVGGRRGSGLGRLLQMFGVLIAVLAALVPLTEIAKLVNIGT
jgi:hypothetical protein